MKDYFSQLAHHTGLSFGPAGRTASVYEKHAPLDVTEVIFTTQPDAVTPEAPAPGQEHVVPITSPTISITTPIHVEAISPITPESQRPLEYRSVVISEQPLTFSESSFLEQPQPRAPERESVEFGVDQTPPSPGSEPTRVAAGIEEPQIHFEAPQHTTLDARNLSEPTHRLQTEQTVIRIVPPERVVNERGEQPLAVYEHTDRELDVREYIQDVRAWVAAAPTAEQSDPAAIMQQREPGVVIEQRELSAVIEQREPGVVIEQREPRVVIEQRELVAVVEQREPGVVVEHKKRDATSEQIERYGTIEQIQPELHQEVSLSIGNISIVIEGPNTTAPVTPPPVSAVAETSPHVSASEPTSLSRYYLSPL